MKSLICGVGINDSTSPRTKTKQGRRVWTCPYYLVWKSMIERCYSYQKQKALINYRGVTVCEEWLTFSTFQKWMQGQHWKGKSIDKDIIKINNKIYSSETCCFVSDKVNSLLTNKKNTKSNCSQGVSWDTINKKFKVSVSFKGLNTHIGLFISEKEASTAYKKAKASHILSVAKKQSEQRVRDGLIRHAQHLLFF